MEICTHCNKEYSKFGLKNHEMYCEANPNRKTRNGKANPNYGKKGKNQYNYGAMISEETKHKISQKSKGRKLTETHKNAISEGMKKAVSEKPESYSSSNVNGRVKKVEHNNVLLDSEWEKIFAKWLDENDIKWERPTIGFKYKWEGERLYYPDFYLPDYDLYIEVKGYVRERDYAKWKCVENLKVIKKKDINNIKRNNFKL